jgi:hypothetical protein
MPRPDLRLLSYARDLTVTENKFVEFDRLVRERWKYQADGVLVSSPQVLGDTYEELTANLEKLAAADLALLIVPRKDREQGMAARN